MNTVITDTGLVKTVITDTGLANRTLITATGHANRTLVTVTGLANSEHCYNCQDLQTENTVMTVTAVSYTHLTLPTKVNV